jgi:hypothetical protein
MNGWTHHPETRQEHEHWTYDLASKGVVIMIGLLDGDQNCPDQWSWHGVSASGIVATQQEAVEAALRSIHN